MSKFGNVDFNELETLIIKGKHESLKREKKKYGNTQPQTKKILSEEGHKLKKLEEASEIGKIDYINPKVSKAIIAGRTAKKMNRKQLANKINETEKIVSEYETGKAILKMNIINKLQRALGVKLTGSEFK